MEYFNFVDLGLPSGTLWASSDTNKLHTFNGAYKLFENQLPTRAQVRELFEFTMKFQSRKTIELLGKNGNKLVFPLVNWWSYERFYLTRSYQAYESYNYIDIYAVDSKICMHVIENYANQYNVRLVK